jgi:hypothetical protein
MPGTGLPLAAFRVRVRLVTVSEDSASSSEEQAIKVPKKRNKIKIFFFGIVFEF